MFNPAAVDSLCGMELILKVNVEEKNLTKDDCIYTVEKYSADHDLINKFKKTDHILGELSVE